MSIFSKKRGNGIFEIFDGRTVKYITKRVALPDGTVNHDIVGKGGRIILIDNEIKIFAGDNDIFRCSQDKTECNMLLSGDGATVKGVNEYTLKEEVYTVYFSYYRK